MKMKKILISAFLLSLAAGAGAQGWTDALNYSDVDYLGTARSVGLGNAMTAVGGDLGSLTFNPAGSAVAGYSQFTITPGLSVSTVFSQGSLMDEYDAPVCFQDPVTERMSRLKVPNFGVMTVFDTHNRSGLKRVSFGLVGNMTRDYTNRILASGTNVNTTVAGSLASQADGFPTSVVGGGYDQDLDIQPSWESMVGFHSGIFSAVPGKDNLYSGVTERVLDNGNRALAGRIGQQYKLQRSGYKYDLLMNVGLDFNDRFVLGANVGVVSLNYREDETRSEEAAGEGFPTRFQSLRARSSFRDEGDGVYLKVGFIARPFDGLRIGAAIQTPTLMQIREEYALEGCSVVDGSVLLRSTPKDEWYYNLTTPFRANAGLAYTFGKVAMLSADYEYTDYRGMRFSVYDDYAYDFSMANLDIQDLTGAVHAVRAGLELKPAQSLAIRVGYNLTTGAQYNYLTDDGDVAPLLGEDRTAQIRTAVSFGLGYSSSDSFFADFAVRFQYLPNEYITPYYYYFRDAKGKLYKDLDVPVPELCASSSVCNALLTLGWRF